MLAPAAPASAILSSLLLLPANFPDAPPNFADPPGVPTPSVPTPSTLFADADPRITITNFNTSSYLFNRLSISATVG